MVGLLLEVLAVGLLVCTGVDGLTVGFLEISIVERREGLTDGVQVDR